jgi:hypothetical protein
MANYRVSTIANTSNRTTQEKTNKNNNRLIIIIIIIIIQFNSFFINVLNSTANGQLQSQYGYKQQQ